jgi:hypothetical protein
VHLLTSVSTLYPAVHINEQTLFESTFATCNYCNCIYIFIAFIILYFFDTSNYIKYTASLYILPALRSKGKAVPLQAWSGSEGSMNLRFPDYMTTAQDGGKVVSITHRPPLPPGNASGTNFC